MLIAIDPGPKESAYVIVDQVSCEIADKAIVTNSELLYILENHNHLTTVAIEMVASYGMPVGAEVFETVLWIGRFIQVREDLKPTLIYRKDVKMHLCQSMRAKDSNIVQALKDRFGEVGTKKKPGYFYGFKGDIWQAYAVAVTYLDKHKEIEIEEV